MDDKFYDILLTLENLSQSFAALYDRQNNIKEPVRFASCLMTLVSTSYTFEDTSSIYHITKLGRQALAAEKARRQPPLVIPTISEFKPDAPELEVPKPLKPSYRIDGHDMLGMPIYRRVREDER